MKVLVEPAYFGKRKGYALKKVTPDATVQDFIDAVMAAAEKGISRRRAPERKSCFGCRECCNERIPLTSIDVFTMMTRLGETGESLARFLQRRAYVYIEGPAVDISLIPQEDGYCSFLRPDGTCLLGDDRPFVCKTFYCCPVDRKIKKLRSLIVNTGEDELVRLWLEDLARQGMPLQFHEAYRPAVRREDWQTNPFTGCSSYRQVFLQELCPPPFWSELHEK